MVIILGLYLTFQSKFFQFRNFSLIIKTFIHFFKAHGSQQRGVHPLKAFFAGIGGCVGIGNIAAICTAVQIGGAGCFVLDLGHSHHGDVGKICRGLPRPSLPGSQLQWRIQWRAHVFLESSVQKKLGS